MSFYFMFLIGCLLGARVRTHMTKTAEIEQIGHCLRPRKEKQAAHEAPQIVQPLTTIIYLIYLQTVQSTEHMREELTYFQTQLQSYSGLFTN